ncbi:MAG: hypothetical protein KDB03_11355 [Planctomycetales bacterium]|nr:hypothetical protein [Planctomycetales bacterium]
MIKDASELEPWLIIQGQVPNTSVAMWRIEHGSHTSLAMFSERHLAEDYATENCDGDAHVIQLRSTELVKLMATCFGEGVRFATLDPKRGSARQVFILRDILRAARASLVSNFKS